MSSRIPSQTQVTTAASKADKKKLVCGSCGEELEPDHPGIQCVQGHHYCVDCSKQIVNLYFSDPQTYTPLRCVQCHIELNSGVFERQLTPAQLEFYEQHMLVLVWAKALVGPDERLDNCPFCSFAVIRSTQDSSIFHCERPNCRKTSCLVCRKACPNFLGNFATAAEEAELIHHSICESLAKDKQIFDEAIEKGQKVSCPKCNLSGMKDDSCTHMTCPTCSQIWCYFCEKRVEDCDKSKSGTNTIYDHNTNWDSNPNRCPMYFTQIQDIDDQWANNEQQCLDRFHRIRSLRFLREVVKTLGKQRIDALNNHFRSLDSCGFSLYEILNEDLILFKRRHRYPSLRRTN